MPWWNMDLGGDTINVPHTVGLTTLWAAAVLVKYGAFIQTIVDFLIIAFAIFVAVKVINSLKRKQAEAQRQHNGVGLGSHGALGALNRQRTLISPTRPAIPHMKLHARLTVRLALRHGGMAQPVQPCAQQRRGLQAAGEHPP